MKKIVLKFHGMHVWQLWQCVEMRVQLNRSLNLELRSLFLHSRWNVCKTWHINYTTLPILLHDNHAITADPLNKTAQVKFTFDILSKIKTVCSTFVSNKNCPCYGKNYCHSAWNYQIYISNSMSYFHIHVTKHYKIAY